MCAACETAVSGLPCASKDVQGLRLFCTWLQTSCFPRLHSTLALSRRAMPFCSAVGQDLPVCSCARMMCVPRTAMFPRSHASLPATRVNFTTTELCPYIQIGREPSSDSEIAHIFSPNLPLDIELLIFLSVALAARVVQASFCNERFTLVCNLSA